MSRTTSRSPVRLCATAATLALAVTGIVATTHGGASATPTTASVVTAASTASGTGTGYLSTNGSAIVDSTGAEVVLTGLNWFGMETGNYTFHGLWASVHWTTMIDHMAELGYNTIRVPFSGDALKSGAAATGVQSPSSAAPRRARPAAPCGAARESTCRER